MTDLAPELSKDEVLELGARCARSPIEFCRIFLGDWFPSKMPWVHRGIAALRTGLCDFLLDFGPELWPEGEAEWTVDDLILLVRNFVVPLDPAKPSGACRPIFRLSLDEGGDIVGITMEDVDNTAAIMPRGFSKTTLFNALNLRDVCYASEPFLLYVSETATHAVNQLLTVRGQLENNERLILVYGDMVPNRQEPWKWTDTYFETKSVNDRPSIKMGAIGKGGQIRGMSKDATRPSRITVDDLQEPQEAKIEQNRTRDLQWFMGTLMPARKIFGTGITKVDMIGTLVHPEAIIGTLANDPEWRVVVFSAKDRDGGMLWQYAVDDAKLERLRQSHLRSGTLDEFELEYMSNAARKQGKMFPTGKINIVHHEEWWYVAKAMACDPAISDDPKADFFALACVGIHATGRLHIEDLFAQVGVDPNDQVERFFEMHFAHMLDVPPEQRHHGIEAVAYQKALKTMVENGMHLKSQTWGDRAYFNIEPILHGRTGKIARVQGILKPRYHAGHITAERNFIELTSQLADWPSGKKDAPDVVAMAIQLLDPYAVLNTGDYEPINDNEGNPTGLVQQTRGGLGPPPRRHGGAP